MPAGMFVSVEALYNRKNDAEEVLVTATAESGTALLTVTHCGEAALVVLCKIQFVGETGQKRTD
jgi:hypothetical protein